MWNFRLPRDRAETEFRDLIGRLNLALYYCVIQCALSLKTVIKTAVKNAQTNFYMVISVETFCKVMKNSVR